LQSSPVHQEELDVTSHSYLPEQVHHLFVLIISGCNIVVTGKSTSEQENLPGTIYSVAKEVSFSFL
jgi:hypothetical protein